MSYAQSERLGLSLFTTSYDDKIVQFLKSYIDKNDYIIDSSGQIFQQDFQDHRKVVGGPSLQSLEKAIDLSKEWLSAKDVIVYDIEHWELTPKEEQDDPVSAFNKGADIVHSAGYRFGIAPDRPYLLQSYAKADWKKIDLLVMQLQRLVPDIDELTKTVRDVAQVVRAANSNTEIYVQLSLTLSEPEELIDAIESLKNEVDGVVIVYLPNSPRPDNNSTLENLGKVFSKVAELRSEATDKLFENLDSIKHEIAAEGQDFDVYVANNSNVNNVDFNKQQKKLTIGVLKGAGEMGLIEITIPTILLNGNYSVSIDGTPIAMSNDATAVQTFGSPSARTMINETHARIQIVYDDTSAHNIELIGTTVIPEFAIGLIIILPLAQSIVILLIRVGSRTLYNPKLPKSP